MLIFYQTHLKMTNLKCRHDDDRHLGGDGVRRRPPDADVADRAVSPLLQHHRNHSLLPDPIHEVADSGS